MMKFASFETIVEQIYKALPGQKSDYSKGAQTGVAFVGGYLAGIACAIVSHPADVMVSKLNANRQAGEGFGAAVGRIYKEIGFGGLWNGLPVRYVPASLIGMRLTVSSQYRHGWYAHWFAMDDLRLIQDLHGLPNYWRWRGEEVDWPIELALFIRSLYNISMDRRIPHSGALSSDLVHDCALWVYDVKFALRLVRAVSWTSIHI